MIIVAAENNALKDHSVRHLCFGGGVGSLSALGFHCRVAGDISASEAAIFLFL